MDSRRLWVPAGRPAHRHGQHRRPDRPASAAPDRCRGVRRGLDAGGVRSDLGGSHRRTCPDGNRRGHTHALDALIDTQHVHRPGRAHPSDRHLDREPVRGHRAGSDHRRSATRSLLVGIGVPHQRARHRAPVGTGTPPRSRVPEPDIGATGRAQRPTILRRDHPGRLGDQDRRRGTRTHPCRRGRTGRRRTGWHRVPHPAAASPVAFGRCPPVCQPSFQWCRPGGGSGDVLTCRRDAL